MNGPARPSPDEGGEAPCFASLFDEGESQASDDLLDRPAIGRSLDLIIPEGLRPD